MCGFAGVVALHGDDPESGIAARMRDRIVHRGPDGNAEYEAPGISIAACRLAIVDLDRHGVMPLASPDGRYRIVHNGEIYNRPELRIELERRGVTLLTTTDTEVLLHLYALYGAQMLDRLDGMFAFAIWDGRERELFAARDRVGEKPFFYAEHMGRLFFASEPKALFAAGIPCSFDDTTWSELLTFRSTAGSRTPYKGVKRLLPGEWLRVSRRGLQTHTWWTFSSAAGSRGLPNFGDLLQASVRNRLAADVPVGTLLSGGLDSSSITALAQSESTHPIPAFTVRYDDPDADEGEFAIAAARSSGVEHHQLRVDLDELPELIADATWHLDEPIAFNASPELLAVSRLAAGRVRVLLTGEAADELFGGYGRFRQYRYLPLLRLTGTALRPVRGRLRSGTRWYRFAHASSLTRSDWIAASYADGDPGRFDARPLAEWAPFRAEVASRVAADHPDPVLQALAYERQTHLSAVIDNTDRLTMAAAIEARLPFTSPDLLAYAGQAERSDLFAGAQGKKPIRTAMAGRLPASVLDRRKRGWTSPYRTYLRASPRLRAWLADVPRHPLVEGDQAPRTAVAGIEPFLRGDMSYARDAWMVSRIVLWHQICVEGIRHPF